MSSTTRNLPRLPADDRGFGNVVQLLERVFQFSRDAPQLVSVVVLAPQRQSQDRHVINRAHLDDRLRDSRRDAVEVRVELVVGLYDRVFFFRAHIEAHDHHAQAGMADGVDVLDSRHFAEQLFHGNGDALRYFFGRCPWHLDEDVQHGDDDLRFFLARRLQNAESPEKQSADDDQRCQLRLNENVRNVARQAQDVSGVVRFGRCIAHGRIAIRLPLKSRSPGAATSFSPSCSPESTSICSPALLPRVT